MKGGERHANEKREMEGKMDYFGLNLFNGEQGFGQAYHRCCCNDGPTIPNAFL